MDAAVGEAGPSNLRRRRRSEESWARNVRHSSRVTGASYTSSSGKEVPARQLQERSCRFNCPNGCWAWSETDRQLVMDNFYAIGSEDKQRQFILGLIETDGDHKRVTYLLPKGGVKQRVCRAFFLETLSVGEKFVRNIKKALKTGHVAPVDGRGKHGHQHTKYKYTEFQLEDARTFIKDLPAVPSHYSRVKSTKKYLPTEWRNIQFVFRKYASVTDNPVSLNKFRKIFNDEFNIGFHVPKKDKCATCLNGSNDEHRRLKLASKTRHLKDQERSRHEERTLCTSFDLEAVLNTPKGDSVLFFYSRKVAVYNFTFYEVGSRRGLCHLWDETQGKRGSNEVATLLVRYIERVDKEGGTDELLLYCDNCAGQNKNRTVLTAAYFTLQSCTKLKTIVVNYLLKGHTYMPCDSMHAVIEHHIKRQLVYAPSEWKTIVRTARHDPFPYEVNELTWKDWRDWSGLGKRSMKALKVKDVTRVTMHHGDPNVTVETGFDAGTEKNIRVSSIRQAGRPSFNTPPPQGPPPAYLGRISISAEKKRDLMRLVNDGTIPSEFRTEYEELPATPTVPDVLAESDIEDEDAVEDDE